MMRLRRWTPLWILLLLAPSCTRDSGQGGSRDELHCDRAIPVDDVLAFGKARLDAAVAYVQTVQPNDFLTWYPTSTVTSGDGLGQWKLERADDWRSGFFPGALWQMTRATGDATERARARAWSEEIATLQDSPIDYDLGNRFMTTFGQGYRLGDEGSDPGGAYRAHAKDVLLTAAAALDTRFDMGGIPVGALRALDTYLAPYPVYIDGMMNLELLFEGYCLSGRPTTGAPRAWYEHAVRSAVTTMEQNVRADGSTYHVVQHDDGTHGTPPDGAVYDKISDQGYAPESTWSRGQAWALYGFTVVYRFTRDDPAVAPERFLDTARRTADYFVAHLPANDTADTYNHVPRDFVPPTDFDAALGEPAGPYNRAAGPKPGQHTFTERDSSAAAAAASGLLELSTLVHDPEERARYRSAAEDILTSLATLTGPDGKLLYLARNSVHQGILANGRVAWDSLESSLIYGDYYLLEALNRLRALRGDNRAVGEVFTNGGVALAAVGSGSGRASSPP